MNGLVEKDLRLIFQNRQVVLLFLIMAGVVGFAQDGTFILGYLSFMFTILLTSTISYDELDHGFEFLMTLPITTRTYVKEKYGLCVAGTIFSVLVSGIIYLIAKGMKGEQILMNEDIPMILVFVPIIWCVIALMIPLQLKFGAEKGRIVILLVYGCGAALIFLLMKHVEEEKVKIAMEFLNQLNMWEILLGLYLIGLVLLVISHSISKKVMEQKEY